MSTPAQRSPAQDLILQVRGEQFKEQIALALPENVKPERFVRATVTALLTNPAIAELEPTSVFRALIQCAHDGLLPDGQEAAIVPRKNKATYVAMVGGFRKIAADYGWMLRAQAVFENDEFEYSEEPAMLLHRPVRPGSARGSLIAAYAIATHRDGRRMQAVLHPDEIAKRRAVAETQNIWEHWTPQMWAKTAARDLFADLPLGELDERVQRVLEASRLEPAEAAARLYGPQARAALSPAQREAELERGPTLTPREDEADASEAQGHPASPAPSSEGSFGAGDRQAGGAEVEDSPPDNAPTASPAPDSVPADFSDEPGLPEGEQADLGFEDVVEHSEEETFAIKAEADKAGETVIPLGSFEGKSIADRARIAEPESWIKYVLHRPDYPIHAEVAAYARFYFPSLWEGRREG